jgi:hypothetical protein
VLAVLTALAFVVSGLIGLHHEATTAHAQCEHGELVHGTVASSGLAAATNPNTVARGLPASTQGHEHCELTSATRPPSLDARAQACATIVLADRDAAIAAPHVAVVHRSALYRTAPKTSPPA